MQQLATNFTFTDFYLLHRKKREKLDAAIHHELFISTNKLKKGDGETHKKEKKRGDKIWSSKNRLEKNQYQTLLNLLNLL